MSEVNCSSSSSSSSSTFASSCASSCASSFTKSPCLNEQYTEYFLSELSNAIVQDAISTANFKKTLSDICLKESIDSDAKIRKIKLAFFKRNQSVDKTRIMIAHAERITRPDLKSKIILMNLARDFIETLEEKNSFIPEIFEVVKSDLTSDEKLDKIVDLLI